MAKGQHSEIETLISPEIKDDSFYSVIRAISRGEDIQTVLEIGSSSGGGSTEAFVEGLRDNPGNPVLFCMEVSQPRFQALSQRYASDSFVRCYNVSSVALESFPTPAQVMEFYQQGVSELNRFPVADVLRWLQQDIDYVRDSGVSADGIARIKRDYQVPCFDVVLIDGSEFTGEAELEQVYGAKFILLDDINTYKNYANHRRLAADDGYTLIYHDPHLRNGSSAFRRNGTSAVSWEQKERDLAQALVRPDMVVFDVGAHVGDYTALFSRSVGPGGRVYAFEPVTSTFGRLKERMSHPGHENVRVFQNAVFSSDGEVTFNVFADEYSAWNSIGRPEMLDPKTYKTIVPFAGSQVAQTRSLDSFCEQNGIGRIDFLKVDVEGAEVHVFRGAEGLLRRNAVGFIQFEISAKMLQGMHATARDTFSILNEFGYECRQIREGGSLGERVVDSDAFYENFVAYPSMAASYVVQQMKALGEIQVQRRELARAEHRHRFSLSNEKELRDRLRELQSQVSSSLTALSMDLTATRAELEQARRRIANMEESKFWKIRNRWHSLKGALNRRAG